MKKYIGLFLIVAFAVLPSMANFHKFYVSITEIHYNEAEDNFEISMKLFFDDLNNAMRLEDEKTIDDPIEDYAKDIETFVNRHFSVDINGSKLPMNFVGIETEMDAVWVYYQSEKLPENLENLVVFNNVFVDLFPNQQNIINYFPVKGKAKGVKGLYLNSSEPKGTIKLNN